MLVPIGIDPGVAGDRRGAAKARGVAVLLSDPSAQASGVGVDVAFSFNDEKNLRAPDISVGNLRGEPGWGRGVPPLAIEYADRGQDEAELQTKIRELLGAGTRFIWVVRLSGPLLSTRVENGGIMVTSALAAAQI